MNFTLASLVLSSIARSSSMSSLLRNPSTRIPMSYSLRDSIFSHQLSPIFFSAAQVAPGLVVDGCDFGFFLSTSIQIAGSFAGYIDVDRTTEFDESSNIVTCPVGKFLNSKFHDFTTKRVECGAAFGVGHGSQVTVDNCQFWNIIVFAPKGGAFFVNVEAKNVDISRTCVSNCSTKDEGKGEIHAFTAVSQKAVKIETTSIFNCGAGEGGDMAVIGAPSTSITGVNSSFNKIGYNNGVGFSIKMVTSTSASLPIKQCQFQNNIGTGPDKMVQSIIHVNGEAGATATYAFEQINVLYNDHECIFKFEIESTVSFTQIYSLFNTQPNSDFLYSLKGKLTGKSITGCVSDKKYSDSTNSVFTQEQIASGYTVNAKATPLTIDSLNDPMKSCNPNYKDESGDSGKDDGGKDEEGKDEAEEPSIDINDGDTVDISKSENTNFALVGDVKVNLDPSKNVNLKPADKNKGDSTVTLQGETPAFDSGKEVKIHGFTSIIIDLQKSNEVPLVIDEVTKIEFKTQATDKSILVKTVNSPSKSDLTTLKSTTPLTISTIKFSTNSSIKKEKTILSDSSISSVKDILLDDEEKGVLENFKSTGSIQLKGGKATLKLKGSSSITNTCVLKFITEKFTDIGSLDASDRTVSKTIKILDDSNLIDPKSVEVSIAQVSDEGEVKIFSGLTSSECDSIASKVKLNPSKVDKKELTAVCNSGTEIVIKAKKKGGLEAGPIAGIVVAVVVVVAAIVVAVVVVLRKKKSKVNNKSKNEEQENKP